MKSIELVSCLVITKDGSRVINRDSQIRSELTNPTSQDVTFESADGSEYYLHDLVGKTVRVGKKEVHVGKKRPTRVRFYEEEDF